MIRYLLYYLAAVNVIAFLMYGLDKLKAKTDAWRIPEKTLIGIAALGGSVGALLGMKLFHHKTRHKQFTIGIPAILILQLAAAGFLWWKYFR